MINIKVIGAGAAGNKAVIDLVNSGFNQDDIMLINSTDKDIPSEFRDKAFIFTKANNNLGGCGKERNIGKTLLLRDLKLKNLDLDGLADPDTNAIVIVSSTEGGTGSAATPILAKYIREVLGIPVIVCLLFGFNSDVRGMKNSIEICQELSENIGVIGISNYKFLSETNNNRIKAERMANEKFCDIIRIITGSNIIPSNQNIDDTDLFKIITTPGYMVVEVANNINKIRNQKQFNEAIRNAIDYSMLVDSSGGAKRIGVIYDIPSELEDSIDFDATIIKEEYNTPYEIYSHIQDTKAGTVTWIATGMNMPIRELEEIYENYLNNSKSVNRDRDSFFDALSDMRKNTSEDFDMLTFGSLTTPSDEDKEAFFADFGISATVKKVDTKKTVKNVKKNSEY